MSAPTICGASTRACTESAPHAFDWQGLRPVNLKAAKPGSCVLLGREKSDRDIHGITHFAQLEYARCNQHCHINRSAAEREGLAGNSTRATQPEHSKPSILHWKTFFRYWASPPAAHRGYREDAGGGDRRAEHQRHPSFQSLAQPRQRGRQINRRVLPLPLTAARTIQTAPKMIAIAARIEMLGSRGLHDARPAPRHCRREL